MNNWRKELTLDQDPDDELLPQTPPEVVEVLGFDPLDASLDDDAEGGAVQASDQSHEAAQDAAQKVYEDAFVAFERSLKSQQRPRRKLRLFLAILFQAQQEAYVAAGTVLAEAAGVPAPGPEEALAFASERAKKVAPTTAPSTPGELRRVVETETEATYGHAQLRALAQAGYVTKQWITVGDDRVRETHEACEAQGDIPLAARFSNGLLYPGDPDGPASEVCNCRCWLQGGRRRPHEQ